MSEESTSSGSSASASGVVGAGVQMLQQELERHVPETLLERINSVLGSFPSLQQVPVLALIVIAAVLGSAGITSVAFASAVLGNGELKVAETVGLELEDLESLSPREKLARAIAGEQQGTPQVFSGRLKLRYKGRVIATLEPTGRFRGKAGSGSIYADGKIRLKSKPLGKAMGDGKVKTQKGRRAGRLEDDGTLRNGKGKKIGVIESDGTIRVRSAKVGSVDGATASDLRLVAAYLLLVDRIEDR